MAAAPVGRDVHSLAAVLASGKTPPMTNIESWDRVAARRERTVRHRRRAVRARPRRPRPTCSSAATSRGRRVLDLRLRRG